MRVGVIPKEINHKGLFMFGVIFYLFTPIYFLYNNSLDGLPGIDPWKENVLDNHHLILYLVLVFELVFFFYLGSYLATKYTNPHFSTRRELGKMSAKFILFFVVLFVGYFLYAIRGSAFTGRASLQTLEDNRFEGILSTSGLLIFYIHFVIDQPKIYKTCFLLLFIITAVFLLGIGGRMYVVMPLVAYFIRAYNNAALKGKSLVPYVFIPLIGALSASIIGAIRIGEGLDKTSYFIFTEPIFTSWSSLSYLNHNAIPWIKFPSNFSISLLNFIPSVFWPNKADFLSSMSSNWAKYDNPLGALSIFVSVFGDFGIIGGAIFAFLLGAFFGYLYKAYKTNNINRNLYYCFCAVLPFSFFRDPIAIPIKIFITSFGIIPFLLQVFRQSMKRN